MHFVSSSSRATPQTANPLYLLTYFYLLTKGPSRSDGQFPWSRRCKIFRYRQSQYAGLTRLQLDEVGRERQVHERQGARRADALAEGSVELAQAMVPQALALARGGG
jgi:hypothetical protein